MKHVLVVGLGVSGKSAAAFLLSRGVRVDGVDRRIKTLEHDAEIKLLVDRGLSLTSEEDLEDLNRYDLVIASPGIAQTHPIFVQAAQKGIEICGEIELGCRFVKNKMIGITGTNGKTTVTLLINHILNRSGKSARPLGNVGIPLTSELLTVSADDILVVELSSYQLETLNQRVLDAALILNITPDHLDRYDSMSSYAAAKLKIAGNLKAGAPLYLHEKIAEEYSLKDELIEIKKYGYGPDSSVCCDLTNVTVDRNLEFELPEELRGRKSHEIENLMAVYCITRQFGVTAADFILALQSFQKPPHRIEFVRELAGVRYYDDSKGTNVDAVIRAVESLQGEIILIAGGVDKGSPYAPWLKTFEKKVKLICAIGQSADKIFEEISPVIPVRVCHNMHEAVKVSGNQAKPGEIVLLSPGCSSFDMFRDYRHRGEVFKQAVMDL